MKEEMLPVSDDAKAIMGGVFGLGMTDLSFKMAESKPTARTKAALDELVKAGAIVCESINAAGGVRYKPRIPADPYGKWFRRNMAKGKFPLAEPI